MPEPAPSDPSATAAADAYEVERRRKRDAVRDAGQHPYGRRTDGVLSLAEARTRFPDDGSETPVTVAGRIVLKRDMGKLSFLTLRDDTGDLQVGLQKDKLDDTAWAVRSNLDLGDQIVVTGPLGVTRTGETTVWASSLQMAAKCLLTPPDKHHGLADVEQRYRRRYVDLWANPEVMQTMLLRSKIVERMRQYLKDRGFLEVETPMLQPIHGGAAARPFVTHHNALDMPLYLRIAPELYLKRLLVGGFRKVFEINRNFRNEGISPRHNPEFTMLEAYEAHGNRETMAELVEDMICTIAQDVLGTLVIGNTTPINLCGDESRPRGSRWRRVSMADLVEEKTGWTFDKRPLADAAPHLLERLGGIRDATPDVAASPRASAADASPAEQLVAVFEKLVEPTLVEPTFVTRVPSVIIPLARPCEDDPYFADVYELVINGQEISPGYTELNDPDVQAELFRGQVGDEAERQQIDEDFLTALKYGMPPAGGMGLGVDRLVTMLTGQPSLRDVILFPLLRPDPTDTAS